MAEAAPGVHVSFPSDLMRKKYMVKSTILLGYEWGHIIGICNRQMINL
jgi:hypothetical protein